MKPEWILAALGVFAALFGEDLNRLLGEDRELKRVVLTFAGGIAALCVLMAAVACPPPTTPQQTSPPAPFRGREGFGLVCFSETTTPG